MKRDDFFWLNKINRATVAVGAAAGQFDEKTARLAARGIAAVEALGEKDPAKRVKKYIEWEPMFIEAAGPEATVIHAGRSSQDILSTVRMAMLRDRTLAAAEALDGAVGDLLALAEKNRGVIVPSYTNGVAAQPTAWSHYLSGVAYSLLRCRRRMSEAYARLDRCSMGATVLNGTCWPLDRPGMAEALGFAKPVENALDATSLTPVDLPVEIMQICASAALRISSFICDIMQQYAEPRPWILLQTSSTYISSAMPQKRNPGILNNCREACSDICGMAATAMFRAHNVPTGMIDGKSTAKNGAMLDAFAAMLERFRKILASLQVNPERALEELNSDWTASQEVADRLMLNHGVPFRIGHHMASRMVTVARAENILPLDFPYQRLCEIWKEERDAEWPAGPAELPMSEQEFRDALDPRKITEARRTPGSCSPSEVERMLGEERAELARFEGGRKRAAEHIDAALAKLDERFERFL
jgi:argininosuccinate lyase